VALRGFPHGTLRPLARPKDYRSFRLLGYSSFADPLLPRIPRHFVERSRTDIRLWREHENGGHLPMLEATEALVTDILAFANLVQS
jgi:hypothetical protein